jgi:two-component system chemotaxis response regulator CheY
VASRAVLLVDGDPDARVIVRRLLEHHGYQAIEALDQNEALAIARQRKIALIVSELWVACDDGVGCFIESVKADSTIAHVPVLILTTQGFGDAEQRARRSGSAGYIVKPFSASELMAEIARLVTPSPS